MAANAVRKQLCDLSHKIVPTLLPAFVSKKLDKILNPKKSSHQLFTVSHVICAMQIMSGTQSDNLHQHIAEHKYSAIGRHFVEAHHSNHLLKENQFRVLGKCQEKFGR